VFAVWSTPELIAERRDDRRLLGPIRDTAARGAVVANLAVRVLGFTMPEIGEPPRSNGLIVSDLSDEGLLTYIQEGNHGDSSDSFVRSPTGYPPPPLTELSPAAELAVLLRVLTRHGYDDLRAGHVTLGLRDSTLLIKPPRAVLAGAGGAGTGSLEDAVRQRPAFRCQGAAAFFEHGAGVGEAGDGVVLIDVNEGPLGYEKGPGVL